MCLYQLRITHLKDSIKSLYDRYNECTGVSTDTRKIEPGNMFFALKGPNFDGNQYARQALDNGAKYAVVDDLSLGNEKNCILVEDGLKALQALAIYHRSKFDIPVLAITGSNGKTTTKELISRVLATSVGVHCTSGNLNNHIGVPLTLLSMSLDTEIAVVEMGANHLGEIARYCEIAKPTHGIITNLGTAHVGEFGGRENLIRAKSELFDFLRKNDGVPFINSRDEVLSNMARRFQDPVLFPDKNCQMKNSAPFVQYEDADGILHNTHLVGGYNYMNASAALCVGAYFDVDMQKAMEAIDTYRPENNRSQIVMLGTNTVILDAYNANPDSTRAALDNLSTFDNPNKLALLGDMKELGEYSAGEHADINRYVSENQIPQVFFVGEEYLQALGSPAGRVFLSVDELITFLKKNPISNSTVLIKGSRSMAMEKLTEIKEIWN